MSRGQNRPAGLSRRTRGCGGAGRSGSSDRKYPYRFAYAPSGGPGYSGGGNPGYSTAGGAFMGGLTYTGTYGGFGGGGTYAAAASGPPPTPFNGSNYNVGTNAFSQSFGAGGNTWEAPTISDGTVEGGGSDTSWREVYSSQGGWQLYNPQTSSFSYASPYGGPRLSEQTIGMLQPHVNMFASEKVLQSLDLRSVQVLIGVPDFIGDGRARGLDYPGGINMTSPGLLYVADFATLAHEIVHKMQERNYSSFESFMQERNDQADRYGEDGQYFQEGTLENQAKGFKSDVQKWFGY